MPSKIWNKYKMIKEIESNSNIKTYLVSIEPIIKEITLKNKDDYYIINERLEELKKELNIYEIMEENERIYIVMENNEELLLKIDKLILSDEINIKREGIIQGYGRPITKDEIFNLFKMEKSICKISYETIDGKIGKGSGFFCEIDKKFPIKYALFTNNHILNESNIEKGNIIHFEYLEKSLFSFRFIKKEIKITNNRKIFTNKELDYTCIELFKSDNISNYFRIEPRLFKYDKNNLKDNDIFILQYSNDNDLSFSYGKILSLKDNKIIHNAITDNGSLGSPIIIRSKENYIIGLHYGGIKKNKIEYKFNLATSFDSILDNLKDQISEINCIYIPDKNNNEINLLHDYNLDVEYWTENDKNEYLKVKSNKKLFEENIEIYVNNEKIKFDFKYKFKDSNEIKVRFKFNKSLTNISYMFFRCSSLESIDLSSFNAKNINNMTSLFSGCYSLKSIDLYSFNTTNVNNMKSMFMGCSSLQSIDLSSFNTINVNNMSFMFNSCTSLKSINLSSFNTINVNNMSYMFDNCTSLQSIDLSSFNTINVENMSYMFSCCSFLKKENIKINNKNEKLLEVIGEYLK